MTNEEKFKTPEERSREFKKFCNSKKSCNDCICDGIHPNCYCQFRWLAAEYKESDLPFGVAGKCAFGKPFALIDAHTGLSICGFPQRCQADDLCEKLNATALVWYERQIKKGRE